MRAIYKRELRSYFCGVLGCVMIAVLLVFIGIFTVILNVIGQSPNFEYALVLSVSYWAFLLVIPFITMRSFADERHSKTEQLLLSLPIPIYKIVLAKYLAMLTVAAIPVCITGLYPVLLAIFTKGGAVNFATAYNALGLLLLLCAAMTAIGMFISSLVENQILAAVLTAGLFFLFYFMPSIAYMFPTTPLASLIAFMLVSVLLGALVLAMTKNSTAACIVTGVPAVALLVVYIVSKNSFIGFFPSVLTALSFFEYFLGGGAILGYIDVSAIVFYISCAAVFVFMTVEFIERRRFS